MKVEVLQIFKTKNGRLLTPGEIVEAPEAVLAPLIGKGRVRPVEGSIVRWDSPVFGPLEAPLLEKGPTHFRLIHPLTGETVVLPNDWLISLEERGAIVEFDGGLPLEEANRQARRDIFNLFKKGENNDCAGGKTGSE